RLYGFFVFPLFDVGTGHHLFVTHPRPNHWEHARVRIDHDFQKRRTIVMYEFLKHRLDAIFLAHTDRKLKTIGARSIYKVLAVEELFRSTETFRKEHFLPLPHHPVALVVEEDRL